MGDKTTFRGFRKLVKGEDLTDDEEIAVEDELKSQARTNKALLWGVTTLLGAMLAALGSKLVGMW